MPKKQRVLTYVALVIIAIAAVALGVSLVLQNQPAGAVKVELSSDPFPLAVGQNTLLIRLTNGDGSPVNDASIEVAALMHHGGSLPLRGQTSGGIDGEYRLPITWSMMGMWTLDVSAALPDQPDPLREQYELYIYPVPAANRSSQTTYRSASDNNALLAAVTEKEFWIVIPQGTEALMRTGQGDDIIPEEIRLKVGERSVLVIRNDDIAHHNVGPFFVRAGETIRQTFTSPGVLQGACSVNHRAVINIIVES